MLVESGVGCLDPVWHWLDRMWVSDTISGAHMKGQNRIEWNRTYVLIASRAEIHDPSLPSFLPPPYRDAICWSNKMPSDVSRNLPMLFWMSILAEGMASKSFWASAKSVTVFDPTWSYSMSTDAGEEKEEEAYCRQKRNRNAEYAYQRITVAFYEMILTYWNGFRRRRFSEC